MNGKLKRMNGGLGFAINNPCLVFFVKKCEQIKVIYKNKNDENSFNYIYKDLKMLQKKYGLNGIKIIIEKAIPEHKGFGSKSITKLSIAKAYLELYNIKIEISELAITLKRGGTSGISVNIIEKGGIILDGGRKTKKDIVFSPSSAQKTIEIPPILFHDEMIDVPICLLIPQEKGIANELEKNFFKKNCPISEKYVEKLSRIILSEILPAICEKDLETFCDGINRIQHLKWKKSEIEIYPKKYKKLICHLQKIGYGCGMSSVGPTIYVIGNNLNNLKDEINKTKIKFNSIILTKVNNYGIKRVKVDDYCCNR